MWYKSLNLKFTVRVEFWQRSISGGSSKKTKQSPGLGKRSVRWHGDERWHLWVASSSTNHHCPPSCPSILAQWRCNCIQIPQARSRNQGLYNVKMGRSWKALWIFKNIGKLPCVCFMCSQIYAIFLKPNKNPRPSHLQKYPEDHIQWVNISYSTNFFPWIKRMPRSPYLGRLNAWWKATTKWWKKLRRGWFL